MTDFSTLLWWALGGVALFVGAFLLYMEYGARQLRTRVHPVPGGLRFVAHGFSVESLPTAREIRIKAGSNARYRREHPALASKEEKNAPLEVTLPLPGLSVDVARLSVKPQGEGAPARPTGFCRILFRSSDERLAALLGRNPGAKAELWLDRVPEVVATEFQRFAGGVRFAAEKVEQQLVAEANAARPPASAGADNAQDASAEGESAAAAVAPVDPKARADAQLEQWRAAAGFAGNFTEYGLDDVGRLAWLIDLDSAGGRVILHAGQRTFHGSLKGATVTLLGSDVEVGVRDAFWTKEEPRLTTFRVLSGTPVDHHRMWKQRFGPVIDDLGGD